MKITLANVLKPTLANEIFLVHMFGSTKALDTYSNSFPKK
jgi:hypothetical protein